MRDTSATVSGILQQSQIEPLEVYDIYLDDQTLHFTAFDRDVSFFDPDGDAQTYTALGISRGEIQTTVETRVDACTIRLDNVNLAMSSYAGSNEFRGRRVTIRKIFADISGTWDVDDDVYLFSGIMDIPTIGEQIMEMRCVSRAGTFNVEAPKRSYTLSCPWKFAASGCTDGLSAATLYATASGTTDAGSTVSVINDTERTEADDYWNYGELEFTAGANDGVKRMVTDSVKDTSVTLNRTLDTIPSAGDTYTIKRGCDKTITRCSGLGNAAAFGGFFTLPTQMVVKV